MGGQGRLDELVPGAGAGWWAIRAGSDRQFRGQGPSLGGGRKRGEKNQAIGRSRGGRTTKIHALTDALCRPLSFTLTGGQVADCRAGAELLRGFRPAKSCTPTRVTTRTQSAGKSRSAARSPTSHPKPIASGRTASRRSSIERATPSSACSAA